MTTQPTPLGRRAKIIIISQAHLAPGMNLERWHAILAQHGVKIRANGRAWDGVSGETLDAIVAEIAAIVEEAQKAAEVKP